MSNVITFPGRNPAPLGNPSFAAGNLPTENIRPVEFRVSGHQKAGRARNPLRNPCHRVSHAVTVAGKVHRGEALRVDPFLDEAAILWEGVEAARLLLAELFDLAVKQDGSAGQ